MKFKLREFNNKLGDYVNLPEFYTFVIGLVIAVILGFTISDVNGQEKQDPAKAEEIKTWRIPDYMQENLQRELDDFNKRFEEKVQAYKKELRTRFKEFKDMPDNVILYLEGGFFISRSDFLKLQEQLRDKLKKEVKGDDKTTN